MKKTLWSLSVALVTSVTWFSAAAQAPVGDIKAGEKKVAMCIGCHGIAGYQASFPEIHKVPMISGQRAKYIMAALTAYQKGERRHPTMRGIAQGMSEQDIADVAVYYEAHGRTEGKPELPKAAEGSAKTTALLAKGGCVACHGENFSKPLDPSYPKIAGQHGDYLFVALKSYKADKAALVGRSNGVMAGIAGQFSNAELKELASYVASLPSDLKTVPQAKFR
ncbi:MAG: cytochrome c4 [Rhodoferax sp.]|nr:cytochrome c4 [Rhodoferax sp.]